MECLAVSTLPEGPEWVYEIKLDGYRVVAVGGPDGVALNSRNGKSLNKKFPYIAAALDGLPEGTVIDGELVALDDSGRPVFNLLQNFHAEASRVRYFVFDILRYAGRDLTQLPLAERRSILSSLKLGNNRIKISEYLDVSAEVMLAAVSHSPL